MKILVSENSAFVLGRMNEALCSNGETIVFNYFGSFKQAIYILEKDPLIDLVLLNNVEVNNDKIDIIGYMKQSPRLSSIPIIVVGGDLNAESVAEFLRKGVSDIVMIPIDKKAFIDRIYQVADKGRKKLLVVDDNQDILDILKTFLEFERYVVFTSTSAEGGQGLLEKSNVSAVIADIILPEMDGVEFLRDIKQRHPKMPVILITGYFGKYTPSDIMKAGADGYFMKPFKNRELAYKLREILNR